MDNILQIVRQEAIESKFDRKHIDGYIREAIANDVFTLAQVAMCITMVTEWLEQTFYPSKQVRLNQLKQLDLRKLINDLFVGIAYVQKPELFTSVVAKLAARIGFSDRREAILTVSELLAVMCSSDAFDITKEDKLASLMLVSRIHLPEQLVEYIKNSQYLPPMVCEPLELQSNYDSGYLTHRDSLILGSGNHHNGNICLDVLNLCNRVALRLDTDFLRTVEEEPTKALDTAEKRDLWIEFHQQSARMYMLMHENDNEFYLTHKVDKRGRIYAQGYHINTQGAAYKKASIELAKQELVEGVPA